MTQETWRWVAGYVGLYEVSDTGRVRSYHSKNPRLLRPKPRSIIYLGVELYTREGTSRFVSVHSLVADAFLAEPRSAERPVVRHLDGNPHNNVVSNLARGSHSENAYDMVRHGRHQEARRTHCKNGHEFTEQNTRLRPSGARNCLACIRERSRRVRARNSAPDDQRPLQPFGAAISVDRGTTA